ncbi:haze protective factor 1-like [Aplysia californica]|uniref:Haze protective factor 1-like n=1 Tax=Aplysia californica TaxID=6500 RepID=A0ABM0JPE9_APLCA|nr:haze protective factor 1-like [Aplysia californica]
MVREVEEELGLLSTTAGTTVVPPTTVVTTSRPSGEIQACFNTYVSEIRNSSLEDDLCQPLGRFVGCLLSSADSALTAGQVDNLQNSIDNQLFTNNLTCDINATVIYQDLSPSNTTADQLTAPTTAASTTEAGSSTTGAVNSTSAQTTLTTGNTTLTTGETTLTTGETTLTTGETTLTTGETTLTAGKTTLTTEEITLTAGETSFTTGETTPTTGETTLTTGETTLTTGNNITITQPGYKTVANDETSITRVTTDSGISSSELGNTTTVGSPPTTPAAKASTASPGGVTSLEGNANNYWSTTENTRDSAGLVKSSKIVIIVSIFFALYKNVFESLVD